MSVARDSPSPAVPPIDDLSAPGPLTGIKILELASEWTAFAGKVMADLGAEVVLVEPLGGSPLRRYEPFLDGLAGPDRSLWWWHYQTSKLGVELADDDPRLGELAGHAEVLLTDAPSRTDGLHRDDLIHVTITPFGRGNPRDGEPATDLTILAGGGPVWNCGYDDHSLPPVRGAGNQALHTVGLHAVAATLVAVLHQRRTGEGQRVDLSAHAAANVTTEAGSYEWLVAKSTVQRQTGRHAAVNASTATTAYDNRGRPVNTGFPPRSVAEFRAVREWLDTLGLTDQHPEAFFLDLAIERGGVHLSELSVIPEAMAMFGAGRDALLLIAATLTDHEFFVEGQQRGLAVGVINAPEDIVADAHFQERGAIVPVHHDDLDRSFLYLGAPIAFSRSPWRISRRAPRLGEHQDTSW